LSFLDFSTLEKRKKYCERELILNKRLAPGVYLEVKTINLNHQQYSIGGEGIIVDYAVMMVRLNRDREMNRLLTEGKVDISDIRKLALQLLEFHTSTEVIHDEVTPEVLIDDFSDIEQILPFIENVEGIEAFTLLKEIVVFASLFINNNRDLILERSRAGFVRDCHGDLHSGNIFILENPVIFDCIEFNDQFRHIDILNELAFFCMDLEFYGRKDLSDYFVETYLQNMKLTLADNERKLFLFYKLYRANVKTKVNALKVMQSDSDHDTKDRLSLFRKYFSLMVGYYDELVSVG
jgi:aminoglycoside phosphotransferase family enzyme